MKIAQVAHSGIQIEKWYPFTILLRSIKFKRHLKPFKGYVSGDAGGIFSKFLEGAENG